MRLLMKVFPTLYLGSRIRVPTVPEETLDRQLIFQNQEEDIKHADQVSPMFKHNLSVVGVRICTFIAICICFMFDRKT